MLVVLVDRVKVRDRLEEGGGRRGWSWVRRVW